MMIPGIIASVRRSGAASPFSPVDLFGASETGLWLDFSDASTLWQDDAMTVPVTKSGDKIAVAEDKSGNGLHAYQTNAANRPSWVWDGKVGFALCTHDEWFLLPVFADAAAYTAHVVLAAFASGNFGKSSHWDITCDTRVYYYHSAGIYERFQSTSRKGPITPHLTTVQSKDFHTYCVESGDLHYALEQNGTNIYTDTGNTVANRSTGTHLLGRGDLGYESNTAFAGLVILGRLPTALEKADLEAFHTGRVTDLSRSFDEALTVTNGDAETGDMSGWTVTDWAIESTYIIDGTYSFQCTRTGGTMHQDIAVPSGRYSDVDSGSIRARLKWKARTQYSGYQLSNATLEFFDGSMSPLGTDASADINVGYDVPLSFEASAPTGARTIRITFSGSESIRIDAIELGLDAV